MPITLDQYARTRPFLYHLTARENIEHIRLSKRLESAATLLAAAAREGYAREKRDEMMPVTIHSRRVLLRDQKPLHAGNIAFAPGWSFERLIEDLNRRVFFWSGWEWGPIQYGLNHFRRYESDNPMIIRVRFDSLLRCNSGNNPQFCKYNSGSPRWNQGKPSPRGPETFLPADRFEHMPGDVVEVTFLQHVVLPNDAEISPSPTGPWQSLFYSQVSAAK